MVPTYDENIDPHQLMSQVLANEAGAGDNADTSILSMMDENEANYQAQRLRKFARKFGSPKADQLLTDVRNELFE